METRNNTTERETRSFAPAPQLRTEQRESGEIYIVEGVAAVVESRTDLGWFLEEISADAFKRYFEETPADELDVVALFNHDPSHVLARKNSRVNTLELFVNDNGDLGYRYESPDRGIARDVYDMISRGEVSASSFQFMIEEEKWIFADDRSQPDIRRIEKFKRLIDVSPVTFPAYPDTSVAKRGFEAVKPKNVEVRAFDQYTAQLILNQNKSK
jgi:HK97 family phage prohead protease